MPTLIEKIYITTRRNPLLFQALRPLGGPVYRLLARLTFHYWPTRVGWSLAPQELETLAQFQELTEQLIA